jgi:hypothetical protein
MSGDEAIRELLALDYEFFSRASRCPWLHPCAVEQLHADYAIALNYAGLIASVRDSSLDDARRVIRDAERSFPDAGALVHAKASVLTIVSIHGRHHDRD